MKTTPKIILIAIVLIAGPFIFCTVKDKIHLKRAKTFVKNQKFALAKHEVDKMWCHSPKKIEDCKLFLDIALKNIDPVQLEYISEYCISKGLSDKEIILYNSKSRELRGDTSGAIGILAKELSAGKNEPEYHMTVAQIFTKMNNVPSAVAAYINLFKAANDNADFKFRALGGLMELKAKEQATAVAKALAQANFNQPVPYLLLSRAFIQLENLPDAKAMFEKGAPLMGSLEEKTRGEVSQNFQDVFTKFTATESKKK